MSLPAESPAKNAPRAAAQDATEKDLFEALCAELEEAVRSREKAVEELGKVQEARTETERERAEAEQVWRKKIDALAAERDRLTREKNGAQERLANPSQAYER